MVTGTLATSSNYLSTEVYFTSGYNGSGKVFEGSVFNGFLVKRTRYASTPSNSIGLDNAPGGYINAQQEIADAIREQLDNGFKRWFLKPVITDLVNTHNHIPAKSSLAVSSVSNFGEDFSNRSLVCTGETPFDSYFTPNSNEDHVSLTNESVSYITDEIDGIHRLPLIKSNLVISGPSQFCGNATYTIANLPAGTNVIWNVSPNLTISSANNSSVSVSTNLNATPNGSFGSVQATISTNCSTSLLSKSDILLRGELPTIYGVSENVAICPGSIQYAYNGDSRDGYYNWNVAGGTIISGQGTSTVGFYADQLTGFNTSSTLGLTLTIHDDCGTNLTKGISIPVQNCSGGGTSWRIYPNPSNDKITVTHLEDDTAKQKGAVKAGHTFNLQLFDDKGRKRMETQAVNGIDTIINTKDLPNGTYFLHIIKDKMVTKKQVIIQH